MYVLDKDKFYFYTGNVLFVFVNVARLPRGIERGISKNEFFDRVHINIYVYMRVLVLQPLKET